MSMEDARKQEAVVEAVLFTMGQSVEIRQLAAALECGEQETVEVAERLRNRYDEERRGMQVVRLEDSYQMCTRSSYYENLIRVAATPKKQMLTDVVLETLAIIAYKQPVTKADIERIRGVKSDHAVNRLIEYNLVYEAGRLDAPGRPALFATTEEFLRRFGVGSTGELPEMDLEQREEIRAEVEEELNLKLDGEGRPIDEAAATEQADIGNAEDEAAAAEQADIGSAEDEAAATEQADIEYAEDEGAEPEKEDRREADVTQEENQHEMQ